MMILYIVINPAYGRFYINAVLLVLGIMLLIALLVIKSMSNACNHISRAKC